MNEIKHTPLVAKMERVYTEDGAHIATVWAEPVAVERGEHESWLSAHDRMLPLRNAAQQATFRRAELFAAAPELLEALKAVVSVADRATVEFDMARAAISKATGEQS